MEKLPRSHRRVLGARAAVEQLRSRLDGCPVVQLPTDAPRITRDSSPSPQDCVATSYDLSTLQSDEGLLQVPGSPSISCTASHSHCSSFCCTGGGRGPDPRQLEQGFLN